VADDDDDDDADANDGESSAATAFRVPDEGALESYCGYSLTLSEGFRACEDHCAPSACCRIPAGVEGSCLDTEAHACQVYRDHCSVLENRPASSSSSSSSSSSNEQQDSENWQQDEAAEGPNSPNGGNGSPSRNSNPNNPNSNNHNNRNPNLPDDDHMTDDAEYQYKHIVEAPQDIEAVCSTEAMSASLDGLRACAKYCVNAYCCYDNSPYDCRTKQPRCARYVDPCTRLQNKLQEP
jgi:hypothetical protein